MTVYLSDYWRVQNKFTVFWGVPWIFFGVFFFDKNNLRESIFILLVCCYPLVCMVFLQIYSDKLIVKKISFSSDLIVMTSKKNRNISVDLSKSVYFQIVKSMVGKCRSEEFIILSNDKFEALSKKDSSGIGGVCKFIDKDKTKIVAPYNEKTIPWLKLDSWTQIEVQSDE